MSAVDVSGSLTYTDNVVVGTATGDASWAGDANHFGSTGTADFDITRANAVCTVTGYSGALRQPFQPHRVRLLPGRELSETLAGLRPRRARPTPTPASYLADRVGVHRRHRQLQRPGAAARSPTPSTPAGLKVTKTAPTASVGVGDSFSYTIKVEKIGTTDNGPFTRH